MALRSHQPMAGFVVNCFTHSQLDDRSFLIRNREYRQGKPVTYGVWELNAARDQVLQGSSGGSLLTEPAQCTDSERQLLTQLNNSPVHHLLPRIDPLRQSIPILGLLSKMELSLKHYTSAQDLLRYYPSRSSADFPPLRVGDRWIRVENEWESWKTAFFAMQREFSNLGVSWIEGFTPCLVEQTLPSAGWDHGHHNQQASYDFPLPNISQHPPPRSQSHHHAQHYHGHQHPFPHHQPSVHYPEYNPYHPPWQAPPYNPAYCLPHAPPQHFQAPAPPASAFETTGFGDREAYPVVPLPGWAGYGMGGAFGLLGNKVESGLRNEGLDTRRREGDALRVPASPKVLDSDSEGYDLQLGGRKPSQTYSDITNPRTEEETSLPCTDSVYLLAVEKLAAQEKENEEHAAKMAVLMREEEQKREIARRAPTQIPSYRPSPHLSNPLDDQATRSDDQPYPFTPTAFNNGTQEITGTWTDGPTQTMHLNLLTPSAFPNVHQWFIAHPEYLPMRKEWRDPVPVIQPANEENTTGKDGEVGKKQKVDGTGGKDDRKIDSGAEDGTDIE